MSCLGFAIFRELFRQDGISVNHAPSEDQHLGKSLSFRFICDPPTLLNEALFGGSTNNLTCVLIIFIHFDACLRVMTQLLDFLSQDTLI